MKTLFFAVALLCSAVAQAATSYVLVYPGPGESPATRLILGAQHEVWLNTYELTDRSVAHALVVAARRGVDVKIILTGDPWRASRIAKAEASWCRSNNMRCALAPSRFRFDHAKYLIADGTAWIGTMNFTWSGFNKNREAAFISSDPSVVRAAAAVFRADWTNSRAGAGPRQRLVLSPGAEPQLAALISKAGAAGTVEIESEELGRMDRLTPLLESLGTRLKMVLPSRLSQTDRTNACDLAKNGASIRLLAAPYPHIKMILVPHWAFIGSENLTYTSLYRNREMGIILMAPANGGVLQSTFNRDYASATALICN